MHLFKGERSQGAKGVPSRKLWHALHAIDKYLRGKPHGWSTMRDGTVPMNGSERRSPKARQTFLVNRRMNKSQRMRWSRDGANLLLQVRCAVYNGTLGPGFGHRFDRVAKVDPALPSGMIPQCLDGPIVDCFIPEECANFLRHDGYFQSA